MTKRFLLLVRVAAIFGISEITPMLRTIVDGYVLQCVAWVAQNDATHNPEGVGAALGELNGDPRNAAGDFNAEALAIALGMNGNESDDEILARLREIAAKVYPGLEQQKSLRERMALIGLSADLTTAKENPLAQRQTQRIKDVAHTTALNANVERYRAKHGVDFGTAYAAVMAPRLQMLNATAALPDVRSQVVLLNAQIENYRRSHNCSFETAFTALTAQQPKESQPPGGRNFQLKMKPVRLEDTAL
jgi:hypothetical protein